MNPDIPVPVRCSLRALSRLGAETWSGDRVGRILAAAEDERVEVAAFSSHI